MIAVDSLKAVKEFKGTQQAIELVKGLLTFDSCAVAIGGNHTTGAEQRLIRSNALPKGSYRTTRVVYAKMPAKIVSGSLFCSRVT